MMRNGKRYLVVVLFVVMAFEKLTAGGQHTWCCIFDSWAHVSDLRQVEIDTSTEIMLWNVIKSVLEVEQQGEDKLLALERSITSIARDPEKYNDVFKKVGGSSESVFHGGSRTPLGGTFRLLADFFDGFPEKGPYDFAVKSYETLEKLQASAARLECILKTLVSLLEEDIRKCFFLGDVIVNRSELLDEIAPIGDIKFKNVELRESDVERVRSAKSLRNLIIRDCTFDDALLKRIFDALKDKENFVALNIHNKFKLGKGIGKDASAALFELLSQHRLQCLVIIRNEIDVDGWPKIAEELGKCPIRKLYLYGCHINNIGALKLPDSIEVLSISGNKVKRNDLESLKDSLVNAKNLKNLDVYEVGNKESYTEITDMLKKILSDRVDYKLPIPKIPRVSPILGDLEKGVFKKGKKFYLERYNIGLLARLSALGNKNELADIEEFYLGSDEKINLEKLKFLMPKLKYVYVPRLVWDPTSCCELRENAEKLEVTLSVGTLVHNNLRTKEDVEAFLKGIEEFNAEHIGINGYVSSEAIDKLDDRLQELKEQKKLPKLFGSYCIMTVFHCPEDTGKTFGERLSTVMEKMPTHHDASPAPGAPDASGASDAFISTVESWSDEYLCRVPLWCYDNI